MTIDVSGAGGPPMPGRVALVTGATGGMGLVIATELARRQATVVMLGRSARALDELRRRIVAETGNANVEALVADLADQAQVRRAAAEFTRRHDRLHVLINNAGAHYRDRRVSADGIEMHLAVDHLAGFLLTNLLLDTLRASAPARVVNVVSEIISDSRQVKILPRPRPVALDLDDLQSERHYKPMVAYGRAKLATLMCGYALARHLHGTGVTVNSVHPGVVATTIVGDVAPPVARPLLRVIRPFLLTPQDGAAAALHLATAPELAATTGEYFVRFAAHRSPASSYDPDLQEQVWQASARLVGLAPTAGTRPVPTSHPDQGVHS